MDLAQLNEPQEIARNNGTLKGRTSERVESERSEFGSGTAYIIPLPSFLYGSDLPRPEELGSFGGLVARSSVLSGIMARSSVRRAAVRRRHAGLDDRAIARARRLLALI